VSATRALLAFAAGCVAATLVYALVRAGQVLAGGEANPATIIVRSHHLAYFWRTWTSAFAGALASVSAYLVAGRNPAWVARALLPALTVALVALAIQSALLP
jgi:hypothetical protein